MKTITELHEIFVRAHTLIRQKNPPPGVPSAKWPEKVLVFDTETSIDIKQKLNLGTYRLCKLGAAGYQCIEEGLFYADELPAHQHEIMERYVLDPKNFPLDVKGFPPQVKLKLYNRSQFVERVFWRSIRQ